MMVLLIKLTSFAYSSYDGCLDAETLETYKKSKRIERIPSFLEFLGYCLFFNTIWVGPAIEYLILLIQKYCLIKEE